MKSLKVNQPKRIRMVTCPLCSNTTPVDRAYRDSDSGELMRHTVCAYCYCMFDNKDHPGELMEIGARHG